MTDGLSPYLDWLRKHDVAFAVAGDIGQEPDHDEPLIVDDAEFRAIELEGLPPFVEHRDPGQGIAADHATLSLVRALLRNDRLPAACRFWDIGCGTGVIPAAAGLAGARVVVASDVSARAIELAKRTTSEAGVHAQFLQGSLLEPFPDDAKAEVITTATIPHPSNRINIGGALSTAIQQWLQG